jgi:hypothetical protein
MYVPSLRSGHHACPYHQQPITIGARLQIAIALASPRETAVVAPVISRESRCDDGHGEDGNRRDSERDK